jgi:hypothetical protein
MNRTPDSSARLQKVLPFLRWCRWSVATRVHPELLIGIASFVP